MAQKEKIAAKMIYLVCLSGLPSNMRFRQVLPLFKDVKNHNISYWIRIFSLKSRVDVTKVMIETYSKQDADKLVTLLTGKTVIKDKVIYSCKSFIDSKCDIALTENPLKKNVQQNANPPKKKDLKNKDFESFPTKVKDIKITQKLPELPKFNHPIKILLDEMDSLIKQHCNKQKELFVRTLRTQLQVRLTELFEGRNLHEVNSIPAPDVVSIYRNEYSESTDEAFVIETYNMVQVACWPGTETMSNGCYHEEFGSEDEGTMHINNCENSDNANIMEDTNEEKSSINDEEEWSVASFSDGGNDSNT